MCVHIYIYIYYSPEVRIFTDTGRSLFGSRRIAVRFCLCMCVDCLCLCVYRCVLLYVVLVVFCFDSGESFRSGWNALRGALEALDCRVLAPPEAWSGLTPNPLSLGFEPETSCIRADPLPTELLKPLRLRGPACKLSVTRKHLGS